MIEQGERSDGTSRNHAAAAVFAIGIVAVAGLGHRSASGARGRHYARETGAACRARADPSAEPRAARAATAAAAADRLDQAGGLVAASTRDPGIGAWWTARRDLGRRRSEQR